MDSDSRKKFILSTAANYFGIESNDSAITVLANTEWLDNFLDDGNCFVLSVRLHLTGGRFEVHISNNIDYEEKSENVVVFFKTRPDPITPDNMHSNIFISSMFGSPLNALYYLIQKVYGPTLLQHGKWSADVDPKLQELLSSLQAGLGSVVKHAAAGDSHSTHVIFTPGDEYRYWSGLAERQRDPRAAATSSILANIDSVFAKLDSLSFGDVEDLVEEAGNLMDDLWKSEEAEYPEDRMRVLLDVTGNVLCRDVQSRLSGTDLWHEPFLAVEEQLTRSIIVLQQWTRLCSRMTTMFWPNYPPHHWRGAASLPEHTQHMVARLTEIRNLRTLHKQLVKLLSSTELDELKTKEAFGAFSRLNPLHYNAYTEPAWRAAVKQFQGLLRPAEQRIAGKLRSQLRAMQNNPLQLMHEFSRYRELIQEDYIRNELTGERQLLAGRLGEYVKSSIQTFRSQQGSGPKRLLDVPAVVNNIYWSRQLENRINSVVSVADSLLDDLKGYGELKRSSVEFIEELQEYHKYQFDSWSKDMLEMVNDKTLTLSTDAHVVEFDSSENMRVTFNPRLMGLVREVRQLIILGYTIHVRIMDAANLAKNFMTQAKALEQIATFHNTIGDRIIRSQRPMMLESAMAFAQLVKKQEGITWNKVEAVEAYILKLQAAVESLARNNNRLVTAHYQIEEKVLEMMDTDLLKKQQKWKELLRDIRDVFVNLESAGFRDQTTWRAHWDRQLYKALEHQYQLGLELLSQNLPEIQVELVYRNRHLQFSPPIEEIRLKYYSHVKRFLNIPNMFRGVTQSVNNPIFSIMIERNASRFNKLFQTAEDLFERLEKVKDRFQNWVALGSVDMHDLIEKRCKTSEEFDRNFRTSKAKGQEIGKLPTADEKIGCITVNFSAIRSEIDIINRRYWDNLVSALQHSIMRDCHNVNTFIVDFTDNLTKQPQTVDEVGASATKRNEVISQMPQMERAVGDIEKRNRMLANWTKDRIEHVAKLYSKWDHFQGLLNNYDAVINTQIEALKSNMKLQVTNHKNEIERFAVKWKQFKSTNSVYSDDNKEILKAIEMVKVKKAEWNGIKSERDKLLEGYSQFGMDKPDFTLAEELDKDISESESTFSLFEDYHTGMKSMLDEEWIIFRSKLYTFEEYLHTWRKKLEDMTKDPLVVKLVKDVDMNAELVYSLKFVRGDAFSDQHWKEMYSLLGISSATTVDKLMFGDLLRVKSNIIKHNEQLKELNTRATGEVAIRQALQELDAWEVDARFNLVGHTISDDSSVMLIKDWKDILNKVGDLQILLQSLKDSSYYQAFIDRASIWEKRLADMDEYLANLNLIQRKWVYLEPIFGRGALPKEQSRFKRVNDDFKIIMTDIARDSRVVSLCKITGLRETLSVLLDQLGRCQKSLNEFLEEKRSLFPRFYFIGDEDMLEILGQATNPDVIQAHLKKLFIGIYRVGFDDSKANIIYIKSLEGEMVHLKKPVKVTKDVEVWLQSLSTEMKRTLKQLAVECLKSSKSSGPDPNQFPSQIICLAENIAFTERCEKAIVSNRLKDLLKEQNTQLENYTSQDIDSDDTDGKILNLKLKSLILDTIRNVGIIRELINDATRTIDSWAWQKQLRYYVRSDNVVVIRMVDAEFEYTYEYQGNPPKMVHTPLNDKCFLTMTQAMKMGMGGNPYGPAGTGKTESVKTLGNLFGRQVIVFNCDEGLDVKSMGRIFTGLVMSGAWGCFDEFNRLEESVMSALSMQIQVIQAALKSHTSKIQLLDKEVDMDHSSGIFITMNPAGKGYGGRSKLPDNLKQLFRPVAMSKPDSELITETILYAEGFKHAHTLGKKVTAMFQLAGELLSTQHHYDWGLRAQKPVLDKSGELLKELGNRQADEAAEAEAIVQAIRLNTMSKLTYADTERFEALVKDVFTGVPVRDVKHETLIAAIRQAVDEIGLTYDEVQVQKTVELYEQLNQRVGCILVGPSGCGKSTMLKLLQLAIPRVGQTVKVHTMNPKAMPRTQLLGYIDMDTREWFDGVLTSSARQVIREPDHVRSWIVCDGDIDPEWIESLNSVLDGNRLLTMPSGERIQFGPNVNFIFETHDLKHASPATITRMGMIFLSAETINARTVVSGWMGRQPADRRRMLEQLVEDYFYKALDFVCDMDSFETETSLIGTVMSGLSHLVDVTSKTKFCASLVYGFGANLQKAARRKFATEVFSWLDESAPDGSDPLNFHYNSKRDRLEMFSVRDPKVQAEDLFSDSPPLILTQDVMSTLDYFLPWLDRDRREHFLMVGPEGSGKTQMLCDSFKQLKSTQVAIVHCSAQTTAHHVLQKLSQVCVQMTTNTGRVYRPKESEQLILYLEDINLPKPDSYGTCQLIAFLQQVVAHNGFWGNSLEWVGLENVQIVCSMVGGKVLGRYPISTRFTSIVRLVSVDYPDLDQLQRIYSVYLTSLLREMPGKLWDSWARRVDQLSESTLKLYQQLQSSFNIDEHCHYVFSMRNLSEWLMGIVRYDIAAKDPIHAILKVWAYEACRLFRDRLVSEADCAQFDRILCEVLASDWNFTFEQNPNAVYFVTDGAHTEVQPSVTRSLSVFGRRLGELGRDDWEACVVRAAAQYVAEYRDLEVLTFREVLETTARLERVLSRPGGSVLMAGRSGVGRRSAAGVVSCMLGAILVSPKLGKDYGVKQFQADVKGYMQMAGLENRQVVFVLEDYQIVDSAFLEIVNSLLSSGEVPGLFSSEEIEPMVAALRDAASQDGHRGSLFSYFSSRVRKNLHVVIIMDFRNQSFVIHCQSNPALVKRCSVMWMNGWCRESMQTMPLLLISKDDFNITASQKLSVTRRISGGDDMMDHFVNIHVSMPNTTRTPRKYMQFIKSYLDVYKHRKQYILERQKHLQGGIGKLNEASTVVAELKKQASEQEEKLNVKQGEANRALSMITSTMKSANKQKEEMEVLKSRASKESVILQKKKEGIDYELTEVEPLIAESKRAVGSIRSESLAEVRVLRVPPEVIRDILEGVMGLLGINDASWNSMKTFLGRRTVKDDILKFDARSITPAQRKRVSKLLKERAGSFDPDNANRASRAAAPLAAWVKANVKYSSILEKIKPLEDEQNALQRNITDAQDSMARLGDDLGNVEKHVQQLTEQLNKSTKEAATIEIGLTKAKETLAASETLVVQLTDEYTRWTEQLEEMKRELDSLPRLSLLAGAFITYLSDASEDIRASSLAKWCQMVDVKNFDFCKLLSSEREILTWKGEGLASDDLSIENGVIVKHCQAVMLLVDPSSRAIDWLKKHLQNSPSGFEVVTQQDEKFYTQLELAVRFGKTLVIEEVNHFEPILFPLIRKDVSTQGTRQTIQVGEKVLDYNENFTLYLATRNSDLNIPPDFASLLTIVNFVTTRAGLTGQLLAMTLQAEKPELEAKRKQLLRQEEENKIILFKLEDKLLAELGSAEGNILDNKVLLQSLQQSKDSSAKIASSIAEGRTIQASLSEKRNVYLPLAEYGSGLFFVMLDLPKLNVMYSFSLAAYTVLFTRALETKSDQSDIGSRISVLKRAVLDSVYVHVSRSLFKGDRLMFALHVAHDMYPTHFQGHEWDLFTGKLIADANTDIESVRRQIPAWVAEDCVMTVSAIRTNLPSLWDTLRLDDSSTWSTFAASAECEQNFPARVGDSLTSFQKLLVVQSLRPDRLRSAMQTFAGSVLALDLMPPPLNMRDLARETTSTSPTLIIFSPGVDPSEELRQVAKQTIGLDRFTEVPMGQGQSEVAIEKLRKCSEEGKWLCLKNLHLVTSWLPLLEKELLRLKPVGEFRLWLTSEPHDRFSPTLLMSSLKVAYEAPPGVKKNLLRTYGTWGPDYVRRAHPSAQRAQALFALAWFHALVQERRTFIPQGWTKLYEFSYADLRAGCDVLDRLASMDTFRWDYVHGLMENAIYGGRVDNSFDIRVLQTYLRDMFNNDVAPGSSSGRQRLGPNISLPASDDFRDYLRIIQGLEEVDNPFYFGLPANIDRSAQRMAGARVISQLRVLMRSFRGADKFDRDNWQKELSPVLGLWRKLNSGANLTRQHPSDRRASMHQQRSADPVTSFVQLEHQSALQQVQLMHRGLAGISRVIRGTMPLSADVQRLAERLLYGETPAVWQAGWSGPEQPLLYMRAVVTRALACANWLQRAENGSLLGADHQPLDLAELFRPGTFLNAVRQQTARLQNVAIDQLQLVTVWKPVGVSWRLAVRVCGLQLEGCRFDGGRLSEQLADSPSVSGVPICTLGWLTADEAASFHSPDSIALPLYQSHRRQQLVTCLQLPSSGHVGKWIKAGAALFLKE